MLNEVVEVVVALQPFDGGFRAAFVYTGNVIDFVTHQGEVIDDLLRGNTKLFNDPVPVHGGFGHGVDEGHVVADQLGHVLVAGRHDHIDALAGGFMGQGADDIVGLDAGHDQQR